MVRFNNQGIAKRWSLLLISFCCFAACKKNDVQGLTDKPVFLKIDDISVVSDNQIHGAPTDQITDAWVYVDDQQIGVFELPCEVPILMDGNRNIKIFGGVKRNGISVNRSQYEFYAPYSIDTLLEVEKTYTLYPAVSYTPSAEVSWKEDFEDVSTLVDSTVISKAAITRIKDPDLVRSGIFVGGIELNNENPSAQIFTVDRLDIPKFVDSYFEIDYKSNVPLKIVVTAHLISGTFQSSEVISLRPSDNNNRNGWRKMYIYLAPILEIFPSAENYQFFFEASLPSTQTTGYVYLDNMKVVH